MTTIDLNAATVERPGDRFERDETELAAASFLTRYSGRTLDAYRHDLRGFFPWAADNHLEVLQATRPHIELFRAWMEDRQLAASTIVQAPLNGVRLLPLRPHRRPDRIEPSPVRPPPAGPPNRRTRTRPLRARRVPVHRRALRPPTRRPRRPARPQRPTRERSLHHQHRGPRVRTRPPNPADHRQGQQARDDPARPSNGPHHRPQHRRTPRRADPATP
jgi:hypothetical protein